MTIKKWILSVIIILMFTGIGQAIQSRYNENAIPEINEGGGSFGGIFYSGRPEEGVDFISRISFVPYILPDSGMMNLIVCEDWRGKENAIYDTQNFCGAERSKNSTNYLVYKNPIIAQVPIDKIDKNISTYSLVKIKGFLLSETFYVEDFTGKIVYRSIVSVDEIKFLANGDLK